jgi:hypothetical protein
MRVRLVLLKRDPEGDEWSREGSPLAFRDDPVETGETKARACGDRWVVKDPSHRDYSVIGKPSRPVPRARRAPDAERTA